MSSFQYTGDAVLDTMTKVAINRNNTVESFIRRHFSLKTLQAPATILEFGAGHGEFIDRFLKDPFLQTMALDLDPVYLKNLSKNHQVLSNLSDLTAPIDFIFSLDVLEHIDDDEAILKEMFQALKPGGSLLLYVPARSELYSPYDAAIGHYRRYGLSELRLKLTRAGFHITHSRYQDFLGYFAAFFNKVTYVLSYKEGQTPTLNPRMVWIYDRMLIPLTNGIEWVWPWMPLGRSVLAVAKKPEIL